MSNITTQRTLRVPSDMKQIINQDSIEVYFKEDSNGKPIAMGFAGKRTRPDFYFRFNSHERLTEHLNQWRENLESRNKEVEQRKAKRMQPTTLKPGDILDGLWGYDQTNVDYYQVLKVIGKRTVEIQEIGYKLDWEGGSCASATPIPNSFKGKPMKKVVSDGHYINMNSYLSISPWNGKPASITAPGWGH